MQQNTFREGRIHTVLHETIAVFLQETANTDSFITISYIDLNQSGTTVKVHCSVFPEDQKERAFAFLARKERACKEYIKKHASLRVVPTVRFLPVKEFRTS